MKTIVCIFLIAPLVMQPDQPQLTVVHEETFYQLTEMGLTASVTLKAILPDQSHAELTCFVDSHTSCAEVQSLPPERLPARDSACSDSDGTSMGHVHICKFEDVGDFHFSRKGDKVTVYHRIGKTVFKVTGSW